MDIILRDGSVDLTTNPEEGSYVQVIPSIAVRFTYYVPVELGSPDWIACYILQTDDTQAGPFELLAEMPFLNFTPAGYTYEVLLEPTKAYLRCRFVTSASKNFGAVTLIGVYEAMSEAVYNRLMRAKRISLKQIEACTEQVDEHEAAKVAANAKKADLELEMALFDNYLSDEIAQYELLNP